MGFIVYGIEVVVVRLVDDAMFESLPGGGGVYVVYCSGEGEDPVSVARLLGPDESGTLYIGCTINFRERITNLKKSLPLKNYIGDGHVFGTQYKSNKLIQDRFPVLNLNVILIPSDHPERLEAERLRAYHARFGDLPPFNSVPGRSY